MRPGSSPSSTPTTPTSPSVSATWGSAPPELGHVSLTELATVRGPFGLPFECDLSFNADKPISAYAAKAWDTGRVQT